jgi:capsular polysaccharide export protein
LLLPRGARGAMSRVALTFSADLCAFAPCFDVDEVVDAGRSEAGAEVVSVVEWSSSPRLASAIDRARSLGVPLLRVEPGFLGGSETPPWSLAIESAASSVESVLNAVSPLDASLLARAERCIARIVESRAPIERASEPGAAGTVLVVLRASGDREAAYTFDAMLADAHRDRPDAVVTALAIDVDERALAGATRRHPRLSIVRDPRRTAAVLERAEHVYVERSRLGMEALMRAKHVTCFGAAYYAGWGLTDDRCPIPGRARARTLEEVFAAAYLVCSRYIDQETGTKCELERVIEHLELQRSYAEPPDTEIVALGFSPWKQIFVPKFLGAPANRVRIYYYPLRPPPEAPGTQMRILVWGAKKNRNAARLAKRTGAPEWRMEDGFLRSVGLGSDSYAPASLVLDRSGIYFDPTRPSDLETILETAELDERELARARALRAKIVSLNLSKYNVGTLSPLSLPPRAKGRPIALVIGQVEDDASIRLGCVDVRTNGDLLRLARENRPDAYVIYKPHPDVTSGNRKGAVARAEEWADQVVTDVGIGACLGVVDEVHTLTSLVGFEALLRELRVVVYGQPFYAGWGLTEDRHPHPRRMRRRTLDELVAATLLRYPRYVHPRTGAFTTPEAIVEHLTRARATAAPAKAYDHWFVVRQLRKVVYIASRGRIER